MAQILARNIKDSAVRKLKAQAKRRGRSLEAEVKFILENAADEPKLTFDEALKLTDQIRASFGALQPDSAELIREDRNR